MAQPRSGTDGGGKRPTAGAGAACRPTEGLRLAFTAQAAASAPALAPDRPLCLRLRQGQAAYFRVAGEAGADYAVTTRRLGGQTDTVLSALDAQDRVVAAGDDGGPEPLASRLEIRPDLGVRLIRVGTLDESGGSFEVVLTRLPPLPPVDFPTTLNTARTSPPMALGQSRTIRLARGQRAYFALPEDRENLTVTTSNLQGDTDTVLTVVDEQGRRLAEDDDSGGGFASDLPLAGLPPGRLFLRASTLEGLPGTFDLTLREVPPEERPDYPTSIAAARERPALAPDAVMPLVLRRGRAAIFALPQGQEVLAVTRNLQGSTDTVLALLDRDGNVLAEDDDGGGGFASRLDTRRVNGQAAYLRVSTLGDMPGRFDLVLRVAGTAPTPGEPATSIEEARRRPALPVGEALRITLPSDGPLVFSLPFDGKPLLAMTFGLESGADTLLELLDEQGQVLDQNDDVDGSLASRLEIAATPRPAFLRVSQVGGGASTFQMVLVRPAP